MDDRAPPSDPDDRVGTHVARGPPADPVVGGEPDVRPGTSSVAAVAEAQLRAVLVVDLDDDVPIAGGAVEEVEHRPPPVQQVAQLAGGT